MAYGLPIVTNISLMPPLLVAIMMYGKGRTGRSAGRGLEGFFGLESIGRKFIWGGTDQVFVHDGKPFQLGFRYFHSAVVGHGLQAMLQYSFKIFFSFRNTKVRSLVPVYFFYSLVVFQNLTAFEPITKPINGISKGSVKHHRMFGEYHLANTDSVSRDCLYN